MKKFSVKIIGFSCIILLFAASTRFIFAQTTSSNTVITRVGNPPVGTDPGTGDAPPLTGDPYLAVQDTFGVTVSRNHPEIYAVWIWELLWRFSPTSFDERVEGSSVLRDDSGSHMSGCKTIEIRGTYDTNQQLFNVVFTHEMGHIIRSCTDPNFADEHNTARASEGQLTNYSQTLCLYSGPTAWNFESENYAEMIAYYLLPEISAQTACNPGPNPFDNGAHPLQKAVAQQILTTQPQ